MNRTGSKHSYQSTLEKGLNFIEKIGQPVYRFIYLFLLFSIKINHRLAHFQLPKLPLRWLSLRDQKNRKKKTPPVRPCFRFFEKSRYWLAKKKPLQTKNFRPTRPRRRHPLLFSVSKKIIRRLGWGLLAAGIAAGLLHRWILQDLPDPDRLIDREHVVSTKIYDRHGELLYKMYRNQNRTLVELPQIPASLIQATIAIEDAEFYEHAGFSWRGISRSLVKNIREGKLQGGSTITQQLVKNALLSSEKTLTRKIKELILALRVEMRFSKDEILQMYLNEVGYGGTAYGAEEASWRYFGKSVRDLTLPEAALLAGLPASPTRYSPFGAHPELAKQRQALVLGRMASESFITPQEAQEAQAAELRFSTQTNHIRAPHFVMYIKDLLAEEYGEQAVEEGGLEVTTSLDLEIQTFAEEVLNQQLNQLNHLNVSNGAILITNPATGEILAMVGSRDYFNLEADGNVNVTLQPRQPGSAIKPLTYALALRNGYTPATLIADTPITYHTPGQPPYSPVNYDNRFHGHVTLRQALACSYNVPAVKVLSSLSLDRYLEFAAQMGISTWTEPERYGLAITLGSAEVKMTEMATVYGTFAALGIKHDLQPLIRITDYRGRTHPELTTTSGLAQPVLDPRVAFLITHILADNQARTPVFGSRSQLVIPNHRVAVKTGTSNDLRDNWTIGYTPNLLVAVWVGNNDNSPMSRVASGVTGASPIFNVLMTTLLGQENNDWTVPTGLVQKNICPRTGTLACPGCAVEEYFLEENQPTLACTIRPPEPREQVSSIQTISAPPIPQSVLPTPVTETQSRQKKSRPTSR